MLSLPILLLSGLAAVQALDLRLITHNVRQQTDNLGTDEKSWDERKVPMIAQLAHELAGNPDALLCFQEAKHQQVEDLKSGLGSGWRHYGQGRDGDNDGEFSAILYRETAFDVLNGTTYWLSEHPDEVGSVGWDAAYTRIVTVTKMQHRATGHQMVHMCTHFDHKGTEARRESAKLILGWAGEWSDGDELPVFVGGDLNVDPSSEAYETLTSEMEDTMDLVPEDRRYGYDTSFTGFEKDKEDGDRIDFIFAKNTEGIKFVSFGILHTYYDGFYSSDHRPVVVDAIVA